jgi:hypothetical protein
MNSSPCGVTSTQHIQVVYLDFAKQPPHLQWIFHYFPMMFPIHHVSQQINPFNPQFFRDLPRFSYSFFTFSHEFPRCFTFSHDLSHDFAIHRKLVGRPGGFAGPFFASAGSAAGGTAAGGTAAGGTAAAGSSGAACGKMLDILGECPNNYK